MTPREQAPRRSRWPSVAGAALLVVLGCGNGPTPGASDGAAPDRSAPDATDARALDGDVQADLAEVVDRADSLGADAWPGGDLPDLTLLDVAVTCPAGQSQCGRSTCADLQRDRENCGACRFVCPAGESCAAGACALPCPGAMVPCAGPSMSRCAALDRDPAHCGACGNGCAAGEACVVGACRLACADGLRACDGRCVNPRADAAHCGACGAACAEGRVCRDGRCAVACEAGQTACGDRCAALASDEAHCGACGVACAAERTCAGGRCACPEGQTDCAGTCADTAADEGHCGACGARCAAGQGCASGRCSAVPPAEDTRAGAREVNLSSRAVTLRVDTSAANPDTRGPCGCSNGRDVFFLLRLTRPELLYADTLGTRWNTSLFLQDATGANVTDARVAGGQACGDDGFPGCTDFGAQSAVFALLPAGTWYLVLSGCGSGPATIHVQHLAAPSGSVGRLDLSGAPRTFSLTGTTRGAGVLRQSCGRGSGPEDAWWSVTCPTAPGVTLTAQSCGLATWDTVLEHRSVGRSPVAACNDDACGVQSSVTSRVAPGAGLHVLYIDGATGESAGPYTLRVHLGACAPPQTACDGACVDLQTSVAHCGACGQACAVGRTCVAGACACPAGTTSCSGACVNLDADGAHCGACGSRCADGMSCAAGRCACPPGLSACASACRDLRGDGANCGACGNRCPAGSLCVAGRCLAATYEVPARSSGECRTRGPTCRWVDDPAVMPDIDGCDILPEAYVRYWHECCNQHDRDWESCTLTQSETDRRFLSCMNAACDRMGVIAEGPCRAAARVVYEAVATQGARWAVFQDRACRCLCDR